jgi:hypothetical protein
MAERELGKGKRFESADALFEDSAGRAEFVRAISRSRSSCDPGCQCGAPEALDVQSGGPREYRISAAQFKVPVRSETRKRGEAC